MIIEAKANRNNGEPGDRRKQLDFNGPEKTSRMPVYFALLITGIAAYLKSVYPAQADQRAEPSPEPLGTSGRAAGRAGPTFDDTDARNTRAQEGSASGNGPVVPPQTSYEVSTEFAFRFARPFEPLTVNIAAHFPLAFEYQPQNDNAPAPAPRDTVKPAVSVPQPGMLDYVGDKQGPREVLDPPDLPTSNNGDQDEGDEDEDEDEDDNQLANRPPMTIGPVRLNDVFAGQVVLIGLSQLLKGSSDPDGDVLTINNITVSGGTLAQIGDGWSFSTLPGMLGTITFAYQISDGLMDILQTAMLEIVRNLHRLTSDNDVHVGTIYDDDIDGWGGDDVIDARAGNDVVVGGLGNDHILGGDGDDQLFGDAGDDIIFGGNGNDLIGGGAGNDWLYGDAGDDVIEGNDGNDLLMGGDGNDILDGGTGEDILDGDAGNDVLQGGDGNDTASGGTGADVIQGGSGHDSIHGDEGDDTLIGDAGDDIAWGDVGDDLIDGGTGEDELNGEDGNDTLAGGEGHDTLSGGRGDDLLDGGTGNDTLDGGEGFDTLDYADSLEDLIVDFLAGTANGETIGADSFSNIEAVIGGSGGDTFVIGETAKVLTGGAGDDLFVFTIVNDAPDISQRLVHDILDFVVGDRIHVADYQISQHADSSVDERFDELYESLEDSFGGDIPIRVSYAAYDDMDHTIIEADTNRDTFFETAIVLHGILVPLNFDHQIQIA